MKEYNWDYGFDSFLDLKESGKEYFDVVVGSGRPQRLYPETVEERRDCMGKQSSSNLNRGLGDCFAPKIR